MKPLKEALQASKSKYLIISISLLIASCAHNFDHRLINSYQGTLAQTLKVKIKQNNDTQRLTVYTSINKLRKEAVLEGVGKFDKHVFTMEISNGEYTFKDHINNKEEHGAIKDFELVPLDERTLFTRIDKNQPQPIIISSPEKNIRVDITVTEQEETR